ncbi:MAG: 3-deoxy-D-manno-octulosonic acid transferase [Pseudomonadota bacterium]
MIYKIYQLLSFLIYPLIHVILLTRVIKGKEDYLRYKEKLGFYNVKRPSGKLIWFHAASIGEFNAILPIIKSITNHNILVTTVTLTAANIAKNNLPSNAFHQFMPLDCINIVKRFYSYWRPNLVIWTESEIWPNIISTCNVPLLLINARISEKSYKHWCNFTNFTSFILSKFDLITAQSIETKNYLEKLGARNIHYFGNLKYLANNFNYDEVELKNIKSQIKNRVVIMAASTHSGEEEMFIALSKNLKENYPKLLIIIAPRHPTRSEAVIKLMEGVNFVTRSSKNPIKNDTEIFLLDTIGEFGLFFRLTDIVCMGGSWKRIAHSFIEPAKLGNLIIFGPNTYNSREVADEFLEKKAALFALDEAEIEKIVREFLEAPKAFANYKNNAIRTVDEMSQVKEKVIGKLSFYLDRL